MDLGYEKILNRLSKVSGVSSEEIDRRVEAKRAKLSGLISREGALQVIAAELGISFDNEKLKIDELLPGMRKVNFVGKVITMYPVREYVTKTGDKGKVANVIIADETGNIKVVLWDTNHIALIEAGDVKEGIVVEVVSGSMRENEVHMGSFSEFKLSNEVFDNVQTEKSINKKQIVNFKVGERVSCRAFVVQSFDPRFFEANKETGRKATEEDIASGKPTEKRAILNITIDDGSENIRAVLFHEMVKKLGIENFDNLELMLKEKEAILGKEMIFVGNIRMNSYSNTPELIVDGVEEIDVSKLIDELELSE